jgi:hypothetical protein
VGGSGAAGVQTAGGYAFAVSGADTAALLIQAAHATSGDVRPSPLIRSDAHVAGEIDMDANHDLWLCTSADTPDTWRKIAGPATAGAFHPVTPGRVYDSRADAPGPVARLVAGQQRLVNVAARRDLDTGAGIENDFVPPHAAAIAANVTVVDTLGAGFLTINPGGITTVGAAAINWVGANQILNNGVTLTLDATRGLTVIAGGDPGAAVHVVIDVTGSYL